MKNYLVNKIFSTKVRSHLEPKLINHIALLDQFFIKCKEMKTQLNSKAKIYTATIRVY